MSGYYQSYAKQTNFKKRFPEANQPSGSQQLTAANSNLNTNVPIPSTGVYNPNNVDIVRYQHNNNTGSINANKISMTPFNHQTNSLGVPLQPNNTEVFTNKNFQSNYFPERNQLSVQQEPEQPKILRERFLAVNSKDRNSSNYVSPNSYVVHLDASDDSSSSAAVGKVYKNVVSVELIGGFLPDQGNIRQEPYLLLHIDELEDTFDGTNAALSKAFAFMQLDSSITSAYWLNLKDNMTKFVRKEYNPPIATLSKLTIKITDQSNNIFDWGGTDTDLDRQHTLFFKIVEEIPDTKNLKFRNVF